MKKSAKKQERKRKTLRVGETEELDDIDDNEPDMKDIDFRLKNDSSRVRQLLESSQAVSYTDVTMLKLIMASGLYPQVNTVFMVYTVHICMYIHWPTLYHGSLRLLTSLTITKEALISCSTPE